jgi:hypothetical protein
MTALAVTFSDSGDSVGRIAHGLQNNQPLKFTTIVSTTGISTSATYFVVNRAADTFQVAATLGGAALALSTNGSGTAYVAPVREFLLAAILTATGGEYGVSAPEDERDLPLTIVQDGTDTASANYDYTACAMPLSIARAEVATGSTRDALRAQAHTALAALMTVMHTNETFGGLAVGVDYTGGGIQTELGKFVFAEASFVVRYQHLRGQPAVLS